MNPVAGLAWRVDPRLKVYAKVGRGFETPTFTELAYRRGASGLNTAVAASRSRHAEAELKWRPAPAQQLDLAVFDIATDDEIFVDRNLGGRSTYRNAGGTTRRGVELAYAGKLLHELQLRASLTLLRARFADGFSSDSGATAAVVAAGNRLPGTPGQSAYAELLWRPWQAWSGVESALELAHTGRIVVNDRNDDAAPAATIWNLRVGQTQRVGDWTLGQLLRIDNVLDRRYVGSVIVNEANGRYFEPAPPRDWLVALTARRVIR